MSNAKRDENSIATLLGVSSVDGVTPTLVYVDPTTHRLLVDSSGGGGFNIEEPVGTIDGSNCTFTVTNDPSAVCVDGLLRRENHGYTYSAGTITVDPLTPPTYDIFAIY